MKKIAVVAEHRQIFHFSSNDQASTGTFSPTHDFFRVLALKCLPMTTDMISWAQGIVV
jgi:hypothetical protein